MADAHQPEEPAAADVEVVEVSRSKVKTTRSERTPLLSKPEEEVYPLPWFRSPEWTRHPPPPARNPGRRRQDAGSSNRSLYALRRCCAATTRRRQTPAPSRNWATSCGDQRTRGGRRRGGQLQAVHPVSGGAHLDHGYGAHPSDHLPAQA
ncbi:hypothetical protein GQ600_19100 [Phytophthora cactorum]|nr:hypothetical protein GQ600_19100 [Phytophthora cactorum]